MPLSRFPPVGGKPGRAGSPHAAEKPGGSPHKRAAAPLWIPRCGSILKNVFTMCPAQCVHDVPVLTEDLSRRLAHRFGVTAQAFTPGF